ncbi:MAG: GTPase family protein [Granulosicoccus sp.]
MRSQRAALWYVLLVAGVPLVTLVVLGLVMLWQNNFLIVVSMTWLLATLIGYALYRLWPTTITDEPSITGKLNTQAPVTDLINTSVPADSDPQNEFNLPTELPLRLEQRDDWTDLDRRVWVRAVETVEHVLNKQPPWTQLPELSLEILTSVSEYYNIESQQLIDSSSAKRSQNRDGKYSFTLPEVLLVLSITSSRYRQLVIDYIPFADQVKVSSLINLYARQDQIKTGARWINTVRRTTRFVNPLAAITAELREQFTNRIFTNLSEKIQKDLMRLLLQELVQVGMDLYSGRLKSSVDELSNFRSESYSDDIKNRAVSAEPLRVVLAGQVSSGKSSLVNALINRLEAETDVLPTTDTTTVHRLQWQVDGNSDNEPQIAPEPLHLIDTVGLTDQPDAQNSLMDIISNADLLIWVARANQPARATDAALYKALQESFKNQPMRRPAPVLLVLTHIDQLKPKAIWQPPYDLQSDVTKARSIRQALESCKQMIGLADTTPAVPVCLAARQEPYNVDMVAAQIMLLQNDALQTQFNRRRSERDSTSGTWRERWNQASKLGTVTGKVLVRSISER